MTAGEYIDHLFGVATGWLGWTPDAAWNTPMAQIHLAAEARVDWAIKTNPFGSSAPEKAEPKALASKLDTAFDRLNGNKQRRKKR